MTELTVVEFEDQGSILRSKPILNGPFVLMLRVTTNVLTGGFRSFGRS